MRKPINKELIHLKSLVLTNKFLIADKKEYLSSTDYQAIKFAEGVMSVEEFAPIKDKRQEARAAINLAEEQIAELEVQIEAIKAK